MPSIIDLFQSSGLDNQVKKDTETLVEQELTGIRIKSAVELNNPILYGNESIRIMNRTTSAVEKQRTANAVDPGDGGLIGKGLSKLTGGKVESISEARDKVNSTLGIPVNLIPTDVAKGLVGKNPVNTPITLEEIRLGGAGTGVGKFLKGLGGGSPSQLAKQAVGKGIDLVKGEIRGALFGRRGSDQPAQGAYKNLIPDYGNIVANRQDLQEQKPQKEGGFTYSSTVDISAEAIKDRNDMSTRLEYIKSLYLNGIFGAPPRTIGKNTQTSENKFNDDETRSGNKPNLYTKVSEDLVKDDSQDLTIDLDKVGFSYQEKVKKKVYGEKTPFRFRDSDTFKEEDFSKQRDSENKYSKQDDIATNTLESKRGIRSGRDIINQSAVSDEDILVDGKDKLEDYDLIPLVIKNTYSGKRAHFRCSITGLTETTSPSWDSSKFLGNPFNLYTYSGVERSVTFTLQLFALNAQELVNNWEKLKFLTYLCYPTGYEGGAGYVIPPFIKFTLGNMYDNKDGFIESLSYTVPDTSTWETGDGTPMLDDEYLNKVGGGAKKLEAKDLKGYKLPKFIDASITVKFVEQRSTTGLSKMYDFKSLT
jgi:hypothetical protein